MRKYVCLYQHGDNIIYFCHISDKCDCFNVFHINNNKRTYLSKYICNEIMNNCSIIQETANDNGYIYEYECAQNGKYISFLYYFCFSFFPSIIHLLSRLFSLFPLFNLNIKLCV